MKTFNNFINEGIRDKMLPKSNEDIRKELDKLDSYHKLEKIFKYKIKLYTDKEIKYMLNDLVHVEKYRIGLNNNIFWLVKEAIDEGVEILDDEEDLVIACRHKNIELIKLLLDNGGDVTVYVLEQAIHIGNIDVVNLLLEHDGIFVLEEYYDDLIYVAEHNKDKEMINFLKELNPYGDDLNEGVRDKMIPKSEEDIKNTFSRILDEIGDKPIKEVIENLSNKKALKYLDKNNLDKIVKTVLEDKEIIKDKFTYDFDNFMVFDNTLGNGKIIINLQNNKIYVVGLYAAKDVINALKELL